MIELRLLNDNDIHMVESWMNKEHVKKWYDIPGECSVDDWISEIKARNTEFRFLTHLIILHEG